MFERLDPRLGLLDPDEHVAMWRPTLLPFVDAVPVTDSEATLEHCGQIRVHAPYEVSGRDMRVLDQPSRSVIAAVV